MTIKHSVELFTFIYVHYEWRVIWYSSMSFREREKMRIVDINYRSLVFYQLSTWLAWKFVLRTSLLTLINKSNYTYSIRLGEIFKISRELYIEMIDDWHEKLFFLSIDPILEWNSRRSVKHAVVSDPIGISEEKLGISMELILFISAITTAIF